MSLRPPASTVLRYTSAALFALLLGAGCNAISGADAYRVGDVDDKSSKPSLPPASGTGGNGAVTSVGSGVVPEQPESEKLPYPAVGVSVTDIVLYQAVSRPLMLDRQLVSSDIPVVAQREALLRVFYQTDDAYDGMSVTARLTIEGFPPREVQGVLGSGSLEGELASTINFEIPAEEINPGMRYRVDVLQNQEFEPPEGLAAQYPLGEDELEAVEVRVSGKLTLTLVPVRYDADGSGRMPDTSAQQVQAYRDRFYQLYPISEIDIQVRPASLNWNSTLASGGNGWQNLLTAVADLRMSDGVSSDNYYYGIFEPANSLAQYCGAGCVAGLGFVGQQSSDYTRTAIGLGFSGDQSADVAAHELGHNHGRPHAPCGSVATVDPMFPYANGGIGVYGYDLLSKTLLAPTSYSDLMGYCDPAWISDHNFLEIFERVRFLNGAQIITPPELMNLRYQRLQVGAEGELSWMPSIELRTPPMGEATAVTVDTAAGPEQVTGELLRYDHLPGGVLFVPPTKRRMTARKALRAVIGGKVVRIGR